MKVNHPLLAAALCGLLTASLASGLLAAETAPPVEPAATTPTGWLSMPKITMPKLTMPKIEMPKLPSDPLAPFKAGARKVSDGAKKAWEGTREMFSFGGEKTAAAKKPTAEQPQTVAEFMAQPRLDP